MATVKIKGIVHQDEHGGGYTFFYSDMSKHGYIPIGPCEFEYEIPADFNPVAAQVAALEKKLTEISDEHMQAVKRIKGKIAELQCIENKVAA